MKKLKRWVIALAAGQLLALRRKDTSFQREISRAPTFLDKAKVVFESLFNFNKEIVEDLRSQDLSTTVAESTQKLKEEYTKLLEKWESLKSEYWNLTKEEWMSKIDELKQNNQWLVDTAKWYMDKVLENPEVKALKDKANTVISELKTVADETVTKAKDIS